MAQPTLYDVHIDAPMTQISVAYLEQASFVAPKIFVPVVVDKRSDYYWIYSKNDFLRDEVAIRSEGAESAGVGYNLTKALYGCEVYAAHKDVSDLVRANADNPLDPDRDNTIFLTQLMMLRQEVDFTSKYLARGVWDNNYTTPTHLWDDYALSDPIGDIEEGKYAILKVTGRKPNTLVISYDAWKSLRHHPDLVDRYKYTNADVLSEQMVAQLFELDRVVVMEAVKATNLEGGTEGYDFISGKDALLAYVNPSPGLLAPSAGYCFVWRGVSGGIGTNVAVSRFRMEALKSDRIEIQAAWDFKVVAPSLGYFFDNVVS